MRRPRSWYIAMAIVCAEGVSIGNWYRNWFGTSPLVLMASFGTSLIVGFALQVRAPSEGQYRYAFHV